MDDIAEQIRSKILEWQNQKGVRVSEQAKQILLAALSAVSYDPHPGWRLPHGIMPWPSMDEGLREIQQDAISKLPEILDSLARQSPDKDNINAFSVLHAASSMLDKFCPFDKSAPNN
jgi:hypothetical protein